MSEILGKAKIALRITTDAYDSEIEDLILSAQADLALAGVRIPEEMLPIVNMAILTYVKAHFGAPADYDKLKASYDEQKAQLMVATGFTDWGDGDV